MKHALFMNNRKHLKVLTWNFASHPGKTRFWAHGAPHCFERDLNEKKVPKKMQKRGHLKNTRKYKLKWTWARRRFCQNRPNGIFWPPLRLPLAPDPSQDPPGPPKWPQNGSKMTKNDPQMMKNDPQMNLQNDLTYPKWPSNGTKWSPKWNAALALQPLHCNTCTPALALQHLLHSFGLRSHAWTFCTCSTRIHVLELTALIRLMLTSWGFLHAIALPVSCSSGFYRYWAPGYLLPLPPVSGRTVHH